LLALFARQCKYATEVHSAGLTAAAILTRVIRMDKGIHILVVDDLEALRMSVCTILRHLGFDNISAAQDGQQALDIIRSNRVDLLITDLDMPAMNGIELLHAIRANDSLKHLPVLFLTGEAENHRVLEAARAGVNDYILKPFTVDVLDRKLQKILMAS
jgi:two-component system, chemotaxis family, chemotaxis protein CheY